MGRSLKSIGQFHGATKVGLGVAGNTAVGPASTFASDKRPMDTSRGPVVKKTRTATGMGRKGAS